MQFYYPMLLTILSSILYHVSQKLTPTTAHPLLTLVVTYAMSAILCLMLLPLFPPPNFYESLHQINWTSVALALSLVGIEVGFLLVYRFGWNISLGTLVANVAVTIFLIPIGTVLHAERLALPQLVGVGACILGLVLTTHK